VTGELALRLYVFGIVAASVAWVLEVLWLVVGRRVWRLVWGLRRFTRPS
jgi:hypothetical protein